MPTFKLPAASIIQQDEDEVLYKQSAIDTFSIASLGLGDITARSERVESLAAVFDLAGFTHFCGQLEPQLAVPSFLNQFLTWLINRIKEEAIRKTSEKGVEMWHPLPFFLKFLGDGILVLWDTEPFTVADLRNAILGLNSICIDYRKQLLPQLRRRVVDAPEKLRCGAARGAVFSVGNGADYVGSPINMAARLQKLPGVTLAFNQRGLDLTEYKIPGDDFFTKTMCLKKVAVKGIGENELVFIKAVDYDKMDKETQTLYKEP